MSQYMTEDLVYQLAFSLMMVQTCEYNDKVEDKISLEKYVTSLKFVENFEKLKASGFLEYLFKSVQFESLIVLKNVTRKSKEKVKNRGGFYMKQMFTQTLTKLKHIKHVKNDFLKVESQEDRLGIMDMIFNQFCGMHLFNELIIAYQKENIADILT
jgi:Sec7-like guanine-nucleotide exchange factor